MMSLCPCMREPFGPWTRYDWSRSCRSKVFELWNTMVVGYRLGHNLMTHPFSSSCLCAGPVKDLSYFFVVDLDYRHQ